MKTLQEVKSESTCQKRVTVCEIFDKDGKLLSRESNRCNPDGGMCHRLGIVQDKNNYDTDSHCNWTHAEINAIANLPIGASPFKAVLHGHSFYCDACESALKSVGVIELIKPDTDQQSEQLMEAFLELLSDIESEMVSRNYKGEFINMVKNKWLEKAGLK